MKLFASQKIISWITTTIVHCSLLGVLWATTFTVIRLKQIEYGSEQSSISLLASIAEDPEEPVEHQEIEFTLPPQKTTVVKTEANQLDLGKAITVSPQRVQMGSHSFVQTDSELNPLPVTKSSAVQQDLEPNDRETEELAQVIPQKQVTSLTPKLSKRRSMVPTAALASAPITVAASPITAMNRPPIFPRQARIQNLRGTVNLRLFLNASGAVYDVEIIKSSGHGIFDAQAVRAVRLWRFSPMTINGIAQKTSVTIPIQFIP